MSKRDLKLLLADIKECSQKIKNTPKDILMMIL
jgi:hypothetical protein